MSAANRAGQFKYTNIYLGLGSNLNNPEQQIKKAVTELEVLAQSRLAGVSSLYLSDPWGNPDQPEYINAVAHMESDLEPARMLALLQDIEHRQGRVRGRERWGARTLDIDILVYDRLQLDEVDLVVPHPYLNQRAFVLIPLFELAGDIDVPGVGPIKNWLEKCDKSAIRLFS